MANKSQYIRVFWTSTALIAAAIACSPTTSGSGDEEPVQGDDPGETGGAPAEEEQEEPTAMGGAGEVITHPLLGAGNYTAADSSDPCTQAQLWELDVQLDLTTGATILFEGKVYEVTGPGDDHGLSLIHI